MDILRGQIREQQLPIEEPAIPLDPTARLQHLGLRALQGPGLDQHDLAALNDLYSGQPTLNGGAPTYAEAQYLLYGPVSTQQATL